MESADKYGAADDPAAPAARGIVMRRALIGRLEEAERVTQISAPAGSGKTVLLRSWIAKAGLVDSAACVQVQRQERDPQRFWISVIDALRDTIAGSKLVRPLTAAPDLNGCAVVERLLEDLDPLEDRLWLVIDDLDELRSAGALRQLQLLVQRAPPELRLVLAARHDLRLGLHRLWLEGQLTELRADDLRFNLDEARALFEMAGITLPDSALAQVHARTEGWAAGLRLAALSLAGHPDPEQFATQFSGSERTVAAYLLDEVLERQSEKVRRMLLRNSVCDRVNGELAEPGQAGPAGARLPAQRRPVRRTGRRVRCLDRYRVAIRQRDRVAAGRPGAEAAPGAARRRRRRTCLRRPGRHPHSHRPGRGRPALLFRQAPQARDEPAGHRQPRRDIVWVSGPLPGAVHDLTAARIRGVLQALAASGLITLSDKGYHGAGEPVLTPYRGKNKPESQKQANRAHAKLRSPGERANAQLKTWRILRKLRCCPWCAGQLAKAIHVLQIREAKPG